MIMKRIWILTRWENGIFKEIISASKLYSVADDLREKLKKEDTIKYDYNIDLVDFNEDI